MNSLSLALIATLSAAPLAAWAHSNPDFDDDAAPILRMQPGLLQYVENTFDVKDTGTAKYPGDDDRRPSPPYIFRARPIGARGPFNLRLLIQPGTSGHILGVVDITRVHFHEPADRPFGDGPAVANRAPITPQPPRAPQAPAAPNPNVQVPELSAGPVDQQPLNGAQTPATPPTPAASQTPAAPEAPAAPSAPNEPTADTPSGPITDSATPPQTPSTPQPGLAPPADPAPTPQ